MAKSEITYAQLEQRARLDLAVSVLSDRNAPPAHVMAARRVLESTRSDPAAMRDAVIKALLPREIRALREWMSGVLARRAGQAPGPDPRGAG